MRSQNIFDWEKMNNELPIPPSASTSEDSLELIRAWIVNGRLQASLKVGLWESESMQEEIENWSCILKEVISMIGSALSTDLVNAEQLSAQIVEKICKTGST